MNLRQRLLSFLFGFKYFEFKYFGHENDTDPALVWIQKPHFCDDGVVRFDMTESPIVRLLLSRGPGYYIYTEIK